MKLFVFLLFNLLLFSQEKVEIQLLGLDAKIVPGAYLRVQGKLVGTSDEFGKFSLMIQKDSLEISHQRYRLKKVYIPNLRLNKKIYLEEEIYFSELVLVEDKKLIIDNNTLPVVNVKDLDLVEMSSRGSLEDALMTQSNIDIKKDVTNSAKLQFRGGESNESDMLISGSSVKNLFTHTFNDFYFKFPQMFRSLNINENALTSNNGRLLSSGALNFKFNNEAVDRWILNSHLGSHEEKEFNIGLEKDFGGLSTKFGFSQAEYLNDFKFSFSNLNKPNYSITSLSKKQNYFTLFTIPLSEDLVLTNFTNYFQLENQFTEEQVRLESSFLNASQLDYKLKDQQLSAELEFKQDKHKSFALDETQKIDQVSIGLAYNYITARNNLSSKLNLINDKYETGHNDTELSLTNRYSYNFDDDEFEFLATSIEVTLRKFNSEDISISSAYGVFLTFDSKYFQSIKELKVSLNAYTQEQFVSDYFFSRLSNNQALENKGSKFSGYSFDVNLRFDAQEISFSYFTKRYSDRLYIDKRLFESYYFLQKNPSIDGAKISWRSLLNSSTTLLVGLEYDSFNKREYFQSKPELKLTANFLKTFLKNYRFSVSYQYLANQVYIQESLQGVQKESLDYDDTMLLNATVFVDITSNLNAFLRAENMLNNEIVTEEQLLLSGKRYQIGVQYEF